MLEIWGWACAAVGSLLSVPQLVRLLKSGTSAGLSLRTWQFNIASAIAWTLHGVRGGWANMIVSNAVIGLLCALILLMIRADRRLSILATVTTAAAVTAALVAAEFLLPPVLFGIAVLIPQVGAQLTQSRELIVAPDLRGVSGAFLALTAVVPSMWFFWGLGQSDASVMVSSLVMALFALFNLAWFTARTRGKVSARVAAL